MRVVLVIQTPAQLREVYGIHNAETMLKSLAARIVFAPKDFTDAREISDELGFTTVRAKSISTPLGAGFDRRGGRSRSQSVSEQRRALLLPQEVKELGAEQAIVFFEGLRPIQCHKIRYFSDSRFRKRLLPPPRHSAPGLTNPSPGSESLRPFGRGIRASRERRHHLRGEARVPGCHGGRYRAHRIADNFGL